MIIDRLIKAGKNIKDFLNHDYFNESISNLNEEKQRLMALDELSNCTKHITLETDYQEFIKEVLSSTSHTVVQFIVIDKLNFCDVELTSIKVFPGHLKLVSTADEIRKRLSTVSYIVANNDKFMLQEIATSFDVLKDD